jgi:hypothetical protein
MIHMSDEDDQKQSPQTLCRPDEQHLERSEHEVLVRSIVERMGSLGWCHEAALDNGKSVGQLAQCKGFGVPQKKIGPTAKQHAVYIAVKHL